MTNEEKMIAQLMKQKKSARVAKKMVKEIFSRDSRYFEDNHTPKTVGEYYKKHLSKNANNKKRKSRTTLQPL